MRQAIWRMILTFSTAKLYKGARVAYKFVQVVPNRANIMVTYSNQQDFAKICRIADFFCEWYFASSHRTSPSQIASHRVSHRKKASVNPALDLYWKHLTVTLALTYSVTGALECHTSPVFGCPSSSVGRYFRLCLHEAF